MKRLTALLIFVIAGFFYACWLSPPVRAAGAFGIYNDSISKVTVNATSTQILTANRFREYVSIVNTGANICYIALGTTANAGQGRAIFPNGGTLELYGFTGFLGKIYGVVTTGNTTLAVADDK